MGRPPDPEPLPAAALIGALDIECSEELMVRALTHRSYAYEHGGLPTNERLEFLGDSVLGVVVTDSLYTGYPDLPEGQLAKLRASIVNMRALAGVARTIAPVEEGGLGAYIYLGRGEVATGGMAKPSILADTLEAVIGATYEHGGISAASVLVQRLFKTLLEGTGSPHSGLDWKTSLQEAVAVRGIGPPDYQVVESGPDHAKEFVAVVWVSGRNLGQGVGSSKKEAEQQAAALAMKALTTGPEMDPGDAAAQ
jgi:ribonuclease-3